ncbi:MAG: MBL fold metallo-hydrolase [Flavobacteriales bacterium]|jgi:hydroxyacylglutathione hydrolase|nr:MBL fold metallo-hydrolase [Flavobacteriales bacterium]
MKIEQIYTGCLAQGAYYIESQGEAAIIDPLRETEPYLKKAANDQATIKYIFETHFHADFVSGHLTLSKQTGAPIVYGPNAKPDFDVIVAQDGQEFTIGEYTLRVLHTPGHTLESSTYLLIDSQGKNKAIFSGDTLFLGDVGRPDLAQKGNLTQEHLAGMLYDSLREKIMSLEDEVIVYPAHGAGSACGKNIMKETVDTLGNQKKLNYALRADMTKAEFITEVTQGLLPPPAYFPLNVKLNKSGYEDLDQVIRRGTHALDPKAFEESANQHGALVLDVRHQDEFVQGHIPQSIFIGIDGSFAPWVGALIQDVQQPLLLVCPEGREEETITRLARVGFDQTIGYLKGSFAAWKQAGNDFDTLSSVSANTFAEAFAKEKAPVFDVRKNGEYRSEHLENAQNTPLDFINQHLPDFPKKGVFYLHCAGGYRSVIAGAILKKRGIHNLINVEGGFKAIKETDLPLTDYLCTSTF